jgi:hypothetical protein
MDENTKIKATEAYSRGALEECGSYLGLQPVAVKYGHAFDETPESYQRRLRAALGLPEPPPEPEGGEEGAKAKTAPAKPAVDPVPESEHEDAPEPEDTESPHHRGGHHRGTRR